MGGCVAVAHRVWCLLPLLVFWLYLLLPLRCCCFCIFQYQLCWSTMFVYVYKPL